MPAAVAEPETAVKYQKRQVFVQSGILKSVIHNDQFRTVLRSGESSCITVGIDDDRRLPGKQQRLVSALAGSMLLGIDDNVF